ncbi:hypothetical protein C8R45DRAFT_1079976 [Mycena sanguinolenta]|nr:hypothetical protein C8R45DRAFT_1079976 [Mycena sanguinolenta]
MPPKLLTRVLTRSVFGRLAAVRPRTSPVIRTADVREVDSCSLAPLSSHRSIRRQIEAARAIQAPAPSTPANTRSRTVVPSSIPPPHQYHHHHRAPASPPPSHLDHHPHRHRARLTGVPRALLGRLGFLLAAHISCRRRRRRLYYTGGVLKELCARARHSSPTVESVLMPLAGIHPRRRVLRPRGAVHCVYRQGRATVRGSPLPSTAFESVLGLPAAAEVAASSTRAAFYLVFPLLFVPDGRLYGARDDRAESVSWQHYAGVVGSLRGAAIRLSATGVGVGTTLGSWMRVRMATVCAVPGRPWMACSALLSSTSTPRRRGLVGSSLLDQARRSFEGVDLEFGEYFSQSLTRARSVPAIHWQQIPEKEETGACGTRRFII